MRPTFSRELGRRSCASPYCVSDALCASYDSPSLHPGERPLSLRGRSVPRSASGGNIQRGLAGHGLGGLPVRRPPPLGSAPGECAGLTMSAPTSSGCERSTMDWASSAPLVDLFVKPMALPNARDTLLPNLNHYSVWIRLHAFIRTTNMVGPRFGRKNKKRRAPTRTSLPVRPVSVCLFL